MSEARDSMSRSRESSSIGDALITDDGNDGDTGNTASMSRSREESSFGDDLLTDDGSDSSTGSLSRSRESRSLSDGLTTDAVGSEPSSGGDDDSYSGSGAVSRPSQNNCQEGVHHHKPSDFQVSPEELNKLDGVDANQRVSIRNTSLRKEVVETVSTESGVSRDVDEIDEVYENELVRSKETHEMVSEFREWLKGYENAYIQYSNDGEIGRAKLQNSHMQGYEDTYYARLKGLERQVIEEYGEENMTTAMLTFSATNETAGGEPRPIADHMAEIRGGYKTARKQLYHVLEDHEWVYARIWEPHQSGYGHMHMGIFILDRDGEVSAEDFAPVMESYTSNTPGAGSEAHDPSGDAVSVNDSVESLSSYISEYMGLYEDGRVLGRPMKEQVFRASLWATQTRRLDFSTDAQEMISRDLERQQEERRQERREGTNTTPEDRGAESERDTDDEPTETVAEGSTTDGESTESTETAEDTSDIDEPDGEEDWELDHIGFVHGSTDDDRHQIDPSGRSATMIETDAHGSPEEVAPIKYVE